MHDCVDEIFWVTTNIDEGKEMKKNMFKEDDLKKKIKTHMGRWGLSKKELKKEMITILTTKQIMMN